MSKNHLIKEKSSMSMYSKKTIEDIDVAGKRVVIIVLSSALQGNGFSTCYVSVLLLFLDSLSDFHLLLR